MKFIKIFLTISIFFFIVIEKNYGQSEKDKKTDKVLKTTEKMPKKAPDEKIETDKQDVKVEKEPAKQEVKEQKEPAKPEVKDQKETKIPKVSEGTDPISQIRKACDSLISESKTKNFADSVLRKKIATLVTSLSSALRVPADSIQLVVDSQFQKFWGVKTTRNYLRKIGTNKLCFDTANFFPTIEAALFSDIQFLSGNNPNGVAQFDIRYAQPVNNRVWVWDKKWKKERDSSGLYVHFVRNVFFRVVFSKLDTNLKSLPIREVNIASDTFRAINRLDLIQYSNLRLFVQPNIFTLTFPNRARFYTDLLFRVYRTQIKDLNGSNTQIYTSGMGVNVKYKTQNFFNKKINLEFGISYMRNKFYEHNLYLVNGPQSVDVSANPSVYEKFEFRKFDNVDVYSYEVKLNLVSKSGNETYLRTIYNATDFLPFAKPIKADFNQFFQLQLGTKISLNEIFGIK